MNAFDQFLGDAREELAGACWHQPFIDVAEIRFGCKKWFEGHDVVLYRLPHTFDYWQSCKSAATPVHPSPVRFRRPDLKRPHGLTCLSPARRQGELLATQNPDGSLVFSAVLKGEQGLLAFLLVPPSPERHSTPTSRRADARSS